MSEVLVISDDLKSLKKVSSYSSDSPDKLRLTIATLLSLTQNIHNGRIPDRVAQYNRAYEEKRIALQQEASLSADAEVKKSIGIKESGHAISEEDALVLGLSTDAVVFDKSNALGIEIGTLNSGMRPKFKISEGFFPKPLKVESLQYKIYSRIGIKTRKIQKEVLPTPEVVQDSTPRWKKLFPGNSELPAEILYVEKPKKVSKIDNSEVMSTEELKYKKMIGKIHDELSEIRKRLEQSTGFASPFERGLKEREQQLVNMLSNVTGVSFPEQQLEEQITYEKSELQEIIEDVVGYVEPLSEEARAEEERDLQAYYSNPDVLETIDRLRHQDVLFSFNDPETQRKVTEAERKYNEQLAREKVQSKEDENVIPFEKIVEASRIQAQILFDDAQYEDFIKNGATEQAKMLKVLNDFIDKTNEAEKAKLVKDGEDQARAIHQYNTLMLGAENQARELHDKSVLFAGAEDQARMLNEQDVKEKDARREKEEKDNLAFLISGAKEQAEELQTTNSLIDGANLQARELHDKNVLFAGAEAQARILKAKNDEDEKEFSKALKRDANEQAEALFTHNRLIDGAETQAQELQTKNDLIDGADEQAILLNYSRSLLEGNEKLVSQIVFSRAASDEELTKGAEEQAEMLMDRNARIVIEESAMEEAKRLFSQSKKNNQGIGTKIEPTELNCSYPLVVGEPKPIKLGIVTQFKYLQARADALRVKSEPTYKEVLSSMKEQLTGDTLDFLQLREDVGRARRAA